MMNKPLNTKRGCLYMVATPIGNLGDFTQRGREVLRQVSVIGCEHIQRTKTLLNSHQIDYRTTTFVVIDDVHELERTQHIIDFLIGGSDVALITDAGTPVISDPGLHLVSAAWREQISIRPVPGPSALTALASVSPIPLNQFHFIGFLHTKSAAKSRQILAVSGSTEPTIFFDAPHRLLDTLETMCAVGLKERKLFLGREITKQYEEYLFGTVEELENTLKQRNKLQGEFIGILAPSTSKSFENQSDSLIHELLPHMKPSAIAGVVAKVSPLSREAAYRRIRLLQEELR